MVGIIRHSNDQLTTFIIHPVNIHASSYLQSRIANVVADHRVLVKAVGEAYGDFMFHIRDAQVTLDETSASPPSSLSAESFEAATDNTVREVLLACQHLLSSLDSTPNSDLVCDDEDHALVDRQITDGVKLAEQVLKQSSLQSVSYFT